MAQKAGFLKQLVDNIKNEMTKNKEMKVCIKLHVPVCASIIHLLLLSNVPLVGLVM